MGETDEAGKRSRHGSADGAARGIDLAAEERRYEAALLARIERARRVADLARLEREVDEAETRVAAEISAAATPAPSPPEADARWVAIVAFIDAELEAGMEAPTQAAAAAELGWSVRTIGRALRDADPAPGSPWGRLVRARRKSDTPRT